MQNVSSHTSQGFRYYVSVDGHLMRGYFAWCDASAEQLDNLYEYFYRKHHKETTDIELWRCEMLDVGHEVRTVKRELIRKDI